MSIPSQPGPRDLQFIAKIHTPDPKEKQNLIVQAKIGENPKDTQGILEDENFKTKGVDKILGAIVLKCLSDKKKTPEKEKKVEKDEKENKKEGELEQKEKEQKEAKIKLDETPGKALPGNADKLPSIEGKKPEISSGIAVEQPKDVYLKVTILGVERVTIVNKEEYLISYQIGGDKKSLTIPLETPKGQQPGEMTIDLTPLRLLKPETKVPLLGFSDHLSKLFIVESHPLLQGLWAMFLTVSCLFIGIPFIIAAIRAKQDVSAQDLRDLEELEELQRILEPKGFESMVSTLRECVGLLERHEGGKESWTPQEQNLINKTKESLDIAEKLSNQLKSKGSFHEVAKECQDKIIAGLITLDEGPKPYPANTTLLSIPCGYYQEGIFYPTMLTFYADQNGDLCMEKLTTDLQAKENAGSTKVFYKFDTKDPKLDLTFMLTAIWGKLSETAIQPPVLTKDEGGNLFLIDEALARSKATITQSSESEGLDNDIMTFGGKYQLEGYKEDVPEVHEKNVKERKVHGAQGMIIEEHSEVEEQDAKSAVSKGYKRHDVDRKEEKEQKANAGDAAAGSVLPGKKHIPPKRDPWNLLTNWMQTHFPNAPMADKMAITLDVVGNHIQKILKFKDRLSPEQKNNLLKIIRVQMDKLEKVVNKAMGNKNAFHKLQGENALFKLLDQQMHSISNELKEYAKASSAKAAEQRLAALNSPASTQLSVGMAAIDSQKVNASVNKPAFDNNILVSQKVITAKSLYAEAALALQEANNSIIALKKTEADRAQQVSQRVKRTIQIDLKAEARAVQALSDAIKPLEIEANMATKTAFKQIESLALEMENLAARGDWRQVIALGSEVMRMLPVPATATAANASQNFWSKVPAEDLDKWSKTITQITQGIWEAKTQSGDAHLWPKERTELFKGQAILTRLSMLKSEGILEIHKEKWDALKGSLVDKIVNEKMVPDPAKNAEAIGKFCKDNHITESEGLQIIFGKWFSTDYSLTLDHLAKERYLVSDNPEQDSTLQQLNEFFLAEQSANKLKIQLDTFPPDETIVEVIENFKKGFGAAELGAERQRDERIYDSITRSENDSGILPNSIIDIRRHRIMLRSLLNPECSLFLGFPASIFGLLGAKGWLENIEKRAEEMAVKSDENSVGLLKTNLQKIDVRNRMGQMGRLEICAGRYIVPEREGLSLYYPPQIKITPKTPTGNSEANEGLFYRPLGKINMPNEADTVNPENHQPVVGPISKELVHATLVTNLVLDESCNTELGAMQRAMHASSRGAIDQFKSTTLNVKSSEPKAGDTAFAKTTPLESLTFIIENPGLLGDEQLQRNTTLALFKPGLLSAWMKDHPNVLLERMGQLKSNIETAIGAGDYKAAAFMMYVGSRIRQFASHLLPPGSAKEPAKISVDDQAKEKKEKASKAGTPEEEIKIKGSQIQIGPSEGMPKTAQDMLQKISLEFPSYETNYDIKDKKVSGHQLLLDHIGEDIQNAKFYATFILDWFRNDKQALDKSKGNLPRILECYQIIRNTGGDAALPFLQQEAIEWMTYQFLPSLDIADKLVQKGSFANENIRAPLPQEILEMEEYRAVFGQQHLSAVCSKGATPQEYVYNIKSKGNEFELHYNREFNSLNIRQKIPQSLTGVPDAWYTYHPGKAGSAKNIERVIQTSGVWKPDNSNTGFVMLKRSDVCTRDDILKVTLNKELQVVKAATIPMTGPSLELCEDRTGKLTKWFPMVDPSALLFLRETPSKTITHIRFLENGMTLKKEGDDWIVTEGKHKGFRWVTDTSKAAAEKRLLTKPGSDFATSLGSMMAGCALPLNKGTEDRFLIWPNTLTSEIPKGGEPSFNRGLEGSVKPILTVTVPKLSESRSSCTGFLYLAYLFRARDDTDLALMYLHKAKQEQLQTGVDTDQFEQIAKEMSQLKPKSLRQVAFQLKAELALSEIRRQQKAHTPDEILNPVNAQMDRMRIVELYQQYTDDMARVSKHRPQEFLNTRLALTPEEYEEFNRISSESLHHSLLTLMAKPATVAMEPPKTVEHLLPSETDANKLYKANPQFAAHLLTFMADPKEVPPPIGQIGYLAPDNVLKYFWHYCKEISNGTITLKDVSALFTATIPVGKGDGPHELSSSLDLARKYLISLAIAKDGERGLIAKRDECAKKIEEKMIKDFVEQEKIKDVESDRSAALLGFRAPPAKKGMATRVEKYKKTEKYQSEFKEQYEKAEKTSVWKKNLDTYNAQYDSFKNLDIEQIYQLKSKMPSLPWGFGIQMIYDKRIRSAREELLDLMNTPVQKLTEIIKLRKLVQFYDQAKLQVSTQNPTVKAQEATTTLIELQKLLLAPGPSPLSPEERFAVLESLKSQNPADMATSKNMEDLVKSLKVNLIKTRRLESLRTRIENRERTFRQAGKKEAVVYSPVKLDFANDANFNKDAPVDFDLGLPTYSSPLGRHVVFQEIPNATTVREKAKLESATNTINGMATGGKTAVEEAENAQIIKGAIAAKTQIETQLTTKRTISDPKILKIDVKSRVDTLDFLIGQERETLFRLGKTTPSSIIRSMLDDINIYEAGAIIEKMLDLYQRGLLKDDKLCESITRFLLYSTESTQLKSALTQVNELVDLGDKIKQEKNIHKFAQLHAKYDELSNIAYQTINYGCNHKRYFPEFERQAEMVDPQFSRKFLVTEYRSGIILRKEQIDIIKKIIENPNRLAQLRMGLGKTSYIMPIVMQVLAEKGNLPVGLVPNELLKMSRNSWDRSTRDYFRQASTVFEFDINDLAHGETYLAEKYLRLLDSKTEGGYVITSIESIAAIENSLTATQDRITTLTTEMIKDATDKREPDQAKQFEISKLRKQQVWLIAMRNVFKANNGLGFNTQLFADEGDKIFDCRNEINQAMGSQALNTTLSDTSIELMEIVKECAPGGLETLSAKTATERDQFMQDIAKKVFEKLQVQFWQPPISEKDWSTYMTNPTLTASEQPKEVSQVEQKMSKEQEAEQKLAVSQMEQKKSKEHTLSPDFIVKIKEIKKNNKVQYEKIMAYKHFLSGTLSLIMQKNLDLDMGVRNSDKCVVIPLQDKVETPNTQFGDQYDLVLSNAFYYAAKAPGDEFLKSTLSRLVFENEKLYTEINREAQRLGITPLAYLKSSDAWKHRLQILKEFVFKDRIRISDEQSKFSVHDAIRGCNCGVASGTMDPTSLPEGLVTDLCVDGTRAVEAETFIRMTQGDEAVQIIADNGVMDKMHEAARDVGIKSIINQGLTVEGLNAYDIVKKMRDANKERQYIFVHPEKRVPYMWTKDLDEPIPFDVKDPTQLQTDICLYYFDPADTRGTDFKIPPGRNLLITGPTTLQSSEVQAAWRLRNLGPSQKVIPVIIRSVAERIKNQQKLAGVADIKLEHIINDIKQKTLEEQAMLNYKTAMLRIRGVGFTGMRDILFTHRPEMQKSTYWDLSDKEQEKTIFTETLVDAELFKIKFCRDMMIEKKEVKFDDDLQASTQVAVLGKGGKIDQSYDREIDKLSKIRISIGKLMGTISLYPINQEKARARINAASSHIKNLIDQLTAEKTKALEADTITKLKDSLPETVSNTMSDRQNAMEQVQQQQQQQVQQQVQVSRKGIKEPEFGDYRNVNFENIFDDELGKADFINVGIDPNKNNKGFNYLQLQNSGIYITRELADLFNYGNNGTNGESLARVLIYRNPYNQNNYRLCLIGKNDYHSAFAERMKRKVEKNEIPSLVEASVYSFVPNSTKQDTVGREVSLQIVDEIGAGPDFNNKKLRKQCAIARLILGYRTYSPAETEVLSDWINQDLKDFEGFAGQLEKRSPHAAAFLRDLKKATSRK